MVRTWSNVPYIPHSLFTISLPLPLPPPPRAVKNWRWKVEISPREVDMHSQHHFNTVQYPTNACGTGSTCWVGKDRQPYACNPIHCYTEQLHIAIFLTLSLRSPETLWWRARNRLVQLKWNMHTQYSDLSLSLSPFLLLLLPPLGADDLLPYLIYTILLLSPEHIHSNLR